MKHGRGKKIVVGSGSRSDLAHAMSMLKHVDKRLNKKKILKKGEFESWYETLGHDKY